MPTGRFAPSPTGELHVGNLRTALVAWLFARSSGSAFLVRMEDLDTQASSTAHAEGQLRDLAAIGLDWDGPVELQSAHLERHHAVIDGLVARGLTYPCFCTRREIREAASAPHGPPVEGAYPGTCRTLDEQATAALLADGRRPALRLRAEGAVESFVDRLAGPWSGVVDDFVLRRNDGAPAYNLAVVVDDAAQGVEEVVRGDDLLASTPRQIHLARLLGVVPPAYAHVPLALGPGGRRLAKRDGAVTLGDLAAAGETPARVLAWIAHSLGLAGRAEAVTPAALLDRFDPSTLPRVPWVVVAG